VAQRYDLVDMVKIVLIAAVGIWLLKQLGKLIPVPAVQSAVAEL
jgi:hypothetical protein